MPNEDRCILTIDFPKYPAIENKNVFDFELDMHFACTKFLDIVKLPETKKYPLISSKKTSSVLLHDRVHRSHHSPFIRARKMVREQCGMRGTR